MYWSKNQAKHSSFFQKKTRMKIFHLRELHPRGSKRIKLLFCFGCHWSQFHSILQEISVFLFILHNFILLLSLSALTERSMNDKTNATHQAHRLDFCVHWGTYLFLEILLSAGCHHICPMLLLHRISSIRCNTNFINTHFPRN